jgi:hypothetical protein
MPKNKKKLDYKFLLCKFQSPGKRKQALLRSNLPGLPGPRKIPEGKIPSGLIIIFLVYA